MSTDTQKWWSYPCEAESGRTVITSGRDCMDKYIASGKYIYRIEVSWQYPQLPDGMPDEEAARTLEQVTDALAEAFDRDKAAVMTGIYTGDGRRDWVFYCKNLRIFQTVFNRALEPLDTLPLLIEAEQDPDWEEYRHLRDTTYIPEEK